MNWRVNSLAKDFSMIDSWDIPLELSDKDKFTEIQKFLMTIDPTDSSSITRYLFKIRYKIGSYFAWDDENSWPSIPETGEQSLTERLCKEDHARNLNKNVEIIKNNAGRLRTVYLFENEALLEVSNKTIYALLHFSLDENRHVKLSVFTKSRGKLSDLYMLAIKPFRHLFVYPALIRFFKKRWELRNV